MRIPILCTLLILFFSCKNKKAELVDLDRLYKDSLVGAQINYEKHKHANDIFNASIKIKVQQDWDDGLKVIHFKRLIDSIELELKKY